MLKRTSCLLIVTALCSMLTNCGLHSRSPSDIPPQLHTLYLDTSNPDSHLSLQLKRTLASLDVHVVPSSTEAPVTLRIMSSAMTHDTPTIFYSGNAVSYTYSLSTTLQLVKRNGKPIAGATTLNVTRSLLQNANQVYTPEATRMMERQLTTTMTSLIYNYLTSSGVRNALNDAFSNKQKMIPHHATSSQTT